MVTQYLPRTAKFNPRFRTVAKLLSRVLLVAIYKFNPILGGAYNKAEAYSQKKIIP